MKLMLRLIGAEWIKLRKTAIVHIVWALPLLFVLLDFMLHGWAILRLGRITDPIAALAAVQPVKSLALLWAGFFHPLMLALIPPMLMRPEHRYNQWKHLHAQPAPRWMLFLTKCLIMHGLVIATLLAAELGLYLEWEIIARLQPLVSSPFPGLPILTALGWSLLGSLPVLAFNLWLSDRISNSSVPIVFGLVGLMITISLAGQEIPPLWRRDLIPWVLPYTCTQHALERTGMQQKIHIASAALQPPKKPNKLAQYLIQRGGKTHAKFNFNPYEDDDWDPLPPTPPWILAAFSVTVTLALLGLGMTDSGRQRA